MTESQFHDEITRRIFRLETFVFFGGIVGMITQVVVIYLTVSK